MSLIKKEIVRHLLVGGLLSASLLLSGCGGSSSSNGGSNDDAGKTGQLIDSAVAGVNYATPSFSGITNADGKYLYKEGESITFSIGNIVFPAILAKGVLTPLDLAGTQDINDRKVINIARLLQSLDDDLDPSNGIVIPAGLTTVALNFDQDVAAFETQVSADMGLALVLQVDALAHLQAELDALAESATDGEPAIVPAGLVGVHSFKYQESQSGAGIANDQVQEFEVMSGNRLRLPSGTILANPVYLNGNKVEVVWQDPVSKLAYALSNAMTGTINELNVSYSLFGQADYQFYGSFQPFNATNGNVPVALLALAGSYNANIYYSNGENPSGWSVGDELTLTIDATTGVIDIAGRYRIDPADESFSWQDDTAKNPRFNPAYVVLYDIPETGVSIKLMLYNRPSEPLNSWRIQELPSGGSGVNVAADITPFIQTHQNYFTSLSAALSVPTTLTVISQDGGLDFGAQKTTRCSEYTFTFYNTGNKPSLMYQQEGDLPRNISYSPSSAAYTDTGSAVSLYWGYQMEVAGEILTVTSYSLGLPLNEVLTNDPVQIEAAGCGDTDNIDDPLNGDTGITGMLNGERYTHTHTTIWNEYSLKAYPAHATIATYDVNYSWTMEYLPKVVGTYQCKQKVGSNPRIQLSVKVPGAHHTDFNTCEIEVISIDQGVITGRFHGVKGENVIEDGFFRYQTPLP